MGVGWSGVRATGGHSGGKGYGVEWGKGYGVGWEEGT